MADDWIEKYEEWMTLDKNETTKAELRQLRESGKLDDLKKRLLNRMEFGTAGLRARMGAGYSMMNDLTIIQTAQGLLRYSMKELSELRTRGVVVGYDGRYNSRRWAEVTANVFLRENVLVYLYSRLCPTPFVPFGVTHFGAALGVMVTASHNPKDDNGYKVYWSNGAQIIPPHDSGIAASIEASLTPNAASWDYSGVADHPLLTDPLDTVMDVYYEREKAALCRHFDANQQSPVKFVYTAMHGVGLPYARRSMERFGFDLCKFIPVVEQVEPDPDFPTVAFPNPEEGKSALDLAIKTADKNGARIILANDPDADRLAVAEKQADDSWRIFTGNEIGTLLGWWMWHSWKGANPSADPSKLLMLASTVSSKILQSIAKVEGFEFEETLTGFKWMGNVADKKRSTEGYTVLFAFEEAIGFMCGDVVLDKDGISALAVVAEMATFVRTRGCGSLGDKITEIYRAYGYHVSRNSYYFCYEKDVILALFERLRCWEGQRGKYPLRCGPVEVTAVRDLTTGHDSSYDDRRARLPVSRSSQMITFTFANGCVLTIRTSGTEPKIKYYSELCGNPEDKRDWKVLEKELEELVENMIDAFYEPRKNNLTARSD